VNKVKLLKTKELAEKLGVHPITVNRMAKDGRIPFIKISDTEFRFNYEEVIEALNHTVK
tara:strand:- start:386 stop:562 length:177 start_codon:yes stop_codon:yes gene_type:complete